MTPGSSVAGTPELARGAAAVALAWGAVVLAFALLPTHGVLSSVAGERETLTTQVGHFAEFALLAALVERWLKARGALAAETGLALAPSHMAPAVGAWLATVAYGAAIEGVQLPLPYRDGQLADLVIDAAGALAGLVVLSAVRYLRRRGVRRRAR